MSSRGSESTGVPVGRPGEEFDPSNNDNTKIELMYNQNARPQPESGCDDGHVIAVMIDVNKKPDITSDDHLESVCKGLFDNPENAAEDDSNVSGDELLLHEALMAELDHARAMLYQNI